MSEGHPDARRYPLPMLWHEVSIARDRIDQRHVTEALLTQSAIMSVLDKKGSENFKKLIKDLSDGG